MNNNMDLDRKERLARAKRKIQLMRRNINDAQTHRLKMLALVREYVAQRPEVTVQVVKKWLK